MGQDEAARVLRHVSRHTDQLAGQFQRQPQPAIADVEVKLVDLLLADTFGRPAPHQPRQR